MPSVGDKVINKNDLNIREVNRTEVVMTFNIYKVLSSEEDDGGYIKLLDLRDGKTTHVKKDLLIKVYEC